MLRQPSRPSLSHGYLEFVCGIECRPSYRRATRVRRRKLLWLDFWQREGDLTPMDLQDPMRIATAISASQLSSLRSLCSFPSSVSTWTLVPAMILRNTNFVRAAVVGDKRAWNMFAMIHYEERREADKYLRCLWGLHRAICNEESDSNSLNPSRCLFISCVYCFQYLGNFWRDGG